MKTLIKELDLLQSKCIGLFKNKYTKSFELIVSINGHGRIIHTIHIGDLGGMIESYYDDNTKVGKFKLFPNNKSLLEMKEDIYALDAFCKQF